MKSKLALFVVVAVWGGQILAQDTSNVADPHKVFAEEAGTWDATVKMYFRGPNGPPTESSGVQTVELVSGGKFSRTTSTYMMRDREFEGHGLFGYDPRTSEYTGLWVDNFTTIPTQLKGTYDVAKKTLTLHGTVADGAGNEIKQKQVTTFVDAQTKTLEIFMLIDADGTTQEVKLMEMTATKRS
jgi:hypothetical protein